ncbi:MAG: heavy-metal-associated domain-containing protein [Chloroflexota bacterium]
MMETRTFHVPNIGCDACVNKIKAELSEISGVTQVEGDKGTKGVSVTWQTPASWSLIAQRLIEIDYPPTEM